MTYEILISKEVKKFLEKRDKKFIQKIDNVFEKIKINPLNPPEIDFKKLVNTQNDYRVRIGKYRILYTVIEAKIIVYVYKADSRGSVYKK